MLQPIIDKKPKKLILHGITIIFSSIVIAILFLVLISNDTIIKTAFAATPICGQNINPENAQSFPSVEALTGVQWVRVEFRSCTFGNDATSEVWTSIDEYQRVLDYYTSNGIGVLLIIDYLSYPQARDNVADFADRAGLIANAYSGYGSLIAFQVWNEPDIWLGGSMQPDEYAEILTQAATQIKAAGGTVVSGSSASGQPSWVDGVATIMGGAWNSLVDYNAIHPYGKRANYPADPSCNIPDGAPFNDLSSIISPYYFAGRQKPIWITEIGLNSTDEQLQADYLECFYKDVRANYSSEVAHITWFAWTDAMVPPMGITDAGNAPKASYYSYYSANGCTQGGVPASTAPAPITPVTFVIDAQAASIGCTAGGVAASNYCLLSEWPVTGDDVNEPQPACACPTCAKNVIDPLEPDRPSNQNYGQKDGTGSGHYTFYDNDIQDFTEILPIIGYTATPSGGGTGSPNPVSGAGCGGAGDSIFDDLFNAGYPMPSPVDPANTAPAIISGVKSRSTDDGTGMMLEEVYQAIEDATGVPCEYMMGLHYIEGGNGPRASFQNGMDISVVGHSTLLESGIAAANDIKDRADNRVNDGNLLDITTIQQLILADSFFGGGGNRQCLWTNYTPIPYPPNNVQYTSITDYGICPPVTDGDDDPHTTNFIDANHTNMAIIYPQGGILADQFCAQACLIPPFHVLCTACPPPIVTQRHSAMSIALHYWASNQ